MLTLARAAYRGAALDSLALLPVRRRVAAAAASGPARVLEERLSDPAHDDGCGWLY